MIAALYARLERGWQLIDATTDPRERRRLEDHWLALLRQYERACNQLATAYTAQPLEIAS